MKYPQPYTKVIISVIDWRSNPELTNKEPVKAIAYWTGKQWRNAPQNALYPKVNFNGKKVIKWEIMK